MLFQDNERLRIYTGEFDRIEGVAAYEFIVKAAHDRGIRGATVFRASMGYGGHNEIHTARILRMSEDLPIVVEIVDEPEKISVFCDEVLIKMKKGLVTRDAVRACTPVPHAP